MDSYSEIIAFAHEHHNEDPLRLLLQQQHYPTVNLSLVAQQLEGQRQASVKWPTLASCDDYFYPPKLNREQSSSEATACYKAQLFLSLGGGTLGTPASARLVAEKTTCIYLRASVDTLAARLAPEAAGRPLLRGAPDLRDRIAALLAGREDVYASTAHVTVDTDGLSPEQIADEIVISCL